MCGLFLTRRMVHTLYIIWTTVSACLTMSTATILALSILTDHWESITYSQTKLAKIASIHNLTVRDYFGDNRLNVITGFEPDTDETFNSTTELLIQMHGGLWSICYDLTEPEHVEIGLVYAQVFTDPLCLSQREETQKYADKTERTKDARQLRLLNLCISSSLVCLIILCACLIVFWAGLAEKQVPPVLVVSVLFVLSGLFAIFSLSFMQVKRQPRLNSSFLDGYTSPIWQESREFQTSWSYYLGWLGVGGCFLSSVAVYVLTRIMRSTLPYLV